ncbi:hypothetical protein UFOVP621_78 [uncultured Caudovirales phage]|uniref:Uncharacterized protein n=1 Tax=uncultured Caudovirales phage TaxID=2100421 RepID=A0A6J5N3L3_9CAUD|nr:hypothetical protein UFOVP621_78 [uncultured Caudovirales phage]
MGIAFTPQGGVKEFDNSYGVSMTYTNAWCVGDAIGVDGLKEYSGSMPTVDLLVKCRSYIQSRHNNPVVEGFDPLSRVESLYNLCRQAIKQKQPIIGWG